MALAILELVDVDETALTFEIDTGTNTQYQLKIGRGIREVDGSEWIDDVYYTTPASRVNSGAGFFASPQQVRLSLTNIEHGRSFAQLETSKANGKAQAISTVIPLPVAAFFQPQSIASSLSLHVGGARSMSARQLQQTSRQVSNRTVSFSQQASFENLLGEIVKIASPIVLDLLKDSLPATPVAAVPSAGLSAVPTNVLIDLLKTILGSSVATATVAHPQSLAPVTANRFWAGNTASFAKPFIFGIDDALIASLVGPVLQVLPQLLNAANQKRIELKKSDNALMAGILTDINKRMMLDKLLQGQQAAQAQGPAAIVSEEQLRALAALVDQLPTQSTATAGSPSPMGIAPLAAQQSLRGEPPAPPHELSAKAMLDFTFINLLEFNGAAKPIFDRTKPITLKPRFTVMDPAPKQPLPKAILKLALYDPANSATRYEKIFKLKNVFANSAMNCRFEPGEVAHLPTNCVLALIGELRWKNARSGNETRAFGASEFVLVGSYFIKSRGPAMSAERELKDMVLYRAFWNKIWEAPVLDGVRGNGARPKFVWDLNVNARYTTLLTAGAASNGVMETKSLLEPDDPDRPTLNLRGRLKAGIELSVAELNKLIPLWNGPTTLDTAKLEAIYSPSFLDSAAREFKYNFKLKGRAGQAGMIWVVPIFKLFGLTLSSVVGADDSGQVTAVADHEVQFPLPVAARLIGLKSAT